VEPFADIQLDTHLTVVGSGHFFRVGEAQFGVRGLIAIESVGPYVPVQHMGPMLMIHTATSSPDLGSATTRTGPTSGCSTSCPARSSTTTP
jgi:hypothetical protein